MTTSAAGSDPRFPGAGQPVPAYDEQVNQQYAQHQQQQQQQAQAYAMQRQQHQLMVDNMARMGGPQQRPAGGAGPQTPQVFAQYFGAAAQQQALLQQQQQPQQPQAQARMGPPATVTQTDLEKFMAMAMPRR